MPATVLPFDTSPTFATTRRKLPNRSSSLHQRTIFSSCPKVTKRNPKQKRPIVAWTGSPNISAATTHPSPREQVRLTCLASTWLWSAMSFRLTVNLHFHVRCHLAQQLHLLRIIKPSSANPYSFNLTILSTPTSHLQMRRSIHIPGQYCLSWLRQPEQRVGLLLPRI